MKISDIVHFKSIPPCEDTFTVSAEQSLFDLTVEEISGWPENLVVRSIDGNTGLLRKELLLMVRRTVPEFMMDVLENSPSGIVVIDRDSRIVYANHSYTHILAISRQRILGKRMRELEPAADILSVLDGSPPLKNHLSHIKSLDRYVRVNIFPLCRNGQLFGAVSFFTDVTEMARLSAALDRANVLADHLRQELGSHRGLPGGFSGMIGRNPDFVDALKTAGTVAVTDVSLLILGEHGVGKDVLARAVHKASPRQQKAFITVNCAAIPDALLESELFGYEDGAFTGARRGGAIGKFELAEGGTLFLDEIGDMPLAMQAKILRALQEKEIEKIGRRMPVPVNVRILAATNRNLVAMVEAGQFRADLYYRLNMVTVTLPPLRKRGDDIALLTISILEKCCQKYGKEMDISPDLISVLQKHDWPGNIRELSNSLEYAVIMCPGKVVGPEHLPSYFATAIKESDQAVTSLPLPIEPAEGVDDANHVSWKSAIRQTERGLLTRTLSACKGNRSEAMRRLGISRKTFYTKLREHGLI